MPVTLSIKNAPDAVVQKLKARATRHHRSLQGELMAIVEAAAREEEALLGPIALLERARSAGVPSSGRSAAIVRRMREGRDAGRRR